LCQGLKRFLAPAFFLKNNLGACKHEQLSTPRLCPKFIRREARALKNLMHQVSQPARFD
jgi:hypothetical protein